MSILFFGWRGVADRVQVHRPAQPITEVEHNPKMTILFFGWEGWQMGFESIDQPSWSSEVERNAKMSILFFWLKRSGGWGLSPSTSPTNHQKLNIIQRQPFYFFAGEGWRTGFKSIDQCSQSSEVECNPKMSILFFWLRGVADRVRVHRPAWPIIRSWM